MQKISESTAAATPAGEFTEGNPVGAIPATPIKAVWLNAIQRELVAVVEGAGLTLDKADDGQLLTAVQRLVASANTWASITAKPSTLAEFGINDAFNKTETNANIQAAIAAHFTTTVTNALAFKAPLQSPALTGTPTAPTASAGDSTTQVANTAFVQAALASALQAGTVAAFARNTPPPGWLKANGAAVSRSSYPALFAELVTAAGFSAQAFTIPIGSSVFTKSAHGMANGARVRLSSTGALPTGLTTGVDYFVEVIDVNTFYLSTTLMGTRIAASGGQSGVHSYLQSWWGLGDGATTFNLPDLRGEFLRGWDDGRGLDAGRLFGTAQMDAMQNITGTFSQGGMPGGTGPFSTTASFGGVGQDAQPNYTATFDASKVVRTAAEERPRNVALLLCIKY